MGLLLFAEYKRYLLNPACMQALTSSKLLTLGI